MALIELQPDELDFAILRVMFRTGTFSLAGVDPRLNVSRIAKSLRVGRARVAARLERWSRAGFLRKYDVWINPALLESQGAWVSVRVGQRVDKSELFERLRLIDGAIFGVEYVGDWIELALIAPDTATLQRRGELLRQITGVSEVGPTLVWRTPEPKRRLTSLDIRIVRSLRERSTATLSEVADAVGISARTMGRRYSRLIDDYAVWFVPVFDFRALARPVISLNVQAQPGLDPAELHARIRARFPLVLQLSTSGIGSDLAPQVFVFFVILPTVAYADELERLVIGVRGVERTEQSVLVQMHDFPQWFDRCLHTLVPRAASTGH
jgi:DNA-binding Lrp family transcriptional regulator